MFELRFCETYAIIGRNGWMFVWLEALVVLVSREGILSMGEIVMILNEVSWSLIGGGGYFLS